jgi:hypothetical protein
MAVRSSEFEASDDSETDEIRAYISLDEVRHVGIDHARRDRVNADAARPERRREVLPVIAR